MAEIDDLSRSDHYVSGNCHHVVHDLGNDAVVWYGDVGAASNTIFNNHDTIQATVICEAIRARMRRACFEARDRIAATL